MMGDIKAGEESSRWFEFYMPSYYRDEKAIAKALSYSKNNYEYQDMLDRASQLNFYKTENNTHEIVQHLHDEGLRIRTEDKVMLFAPNPAKVFKIGFVWKTLTMASAFQGGGPGMRGLRMVVDLYEQNSFDSRLAKKRSFKEMYKGTMQTLSSYWDLKHW